LASTLGLLAILLLWTALAASRMHNMHDMEEGYDRQGFYQTASTISNFKNARGESDLLKVQIVS
jgi:hypothetical protein